MKQPLRLGLIGTGIAARLLHWPALKQMTDRYRLVAVANRTRAKAEAFADMAGLDPGAVYSDYRDLLARQDLDVVLLALPPRLNFEVARNAAEAGLDIICQKPQDIEQEYKTAVWLQVQKKKNKDHGNFADSGSGRSKVRQKAA